MPMVMAANIPRDAQKGIQDLIQKGLKELRSKIAAFIFFVRKQPNQSPIVHQRAFTTLKLRFNSLLDQLDIFADVISQRGDHNVGVWLGGLDALAKDVINIKGHYYDAPPLICYLDRGHGAAIRRARTRLPGGHKNPVGVIKVPRERMVSNGIASSLVHEVGHQGNALLNLISSLRPQLRRVGFQNPRFQNVWSLFERWISEILSDFWSVGTLGICASTGLMGVVTLPKYFVFRSNLDGPHPFPWIRVKISCAFGKALYPDPQWEKLEQLWERFYPTKGLPIQQKKLIEDLEHCIPAFVQLVINHRPASLQGKKLKNIFPLADRNPKRLRHLFLRWQANPKMRLMAKPSLVFAVLGQARADNKISPKKENKILEKMLLHWALKVN
jgi:hypothetical protein